MCCHNQTHTRPAWGQGNLDDTPRLAKWLPTILATLYEQGHTLLDSLHLLCNPALRRAVTPQVKNFAQGRPVA